MEEIKTLIEKIKAHNSEFEKYYSQLTQYNRKVNLTAITEKNEVFVKHFLDSILPIAEIKPGARVVDVGSGAGFPSLPIKIVRPDISLTMVDSLNKRVNFLNVLCEKLQETHLQNFAIEEQKQGLPFNAKMHKNKQTYANINAVHARAEDFCLNNREKFDVAVARAVAKLNTLVEYLLPLVKVGGVVLAYKGSGYADELNEAQKAIEILGGKVEKVLTYNLPTSLENEIIENENLSTKTNKDTENKNLTEKQTETLGERNIILIKKIKPTPKQYPRGQNKPKTQPIC